MRPIKSTRLRKNGNFTEPEDTNPVVHRSGVIYRLVVERLCFAWLDTASCPRKAVQLQVQPENCNACALCFAVEGRASRYITIC